MWQTGGVAVAQGVAVSESKVRDEVQRVGKDCLDAQRTPKKDVHRYAEALEP